MKILIFLLFLLISFSDSKKCSSPCKACASWENSCVFPTTLSTSSATKRNIFSWKNPQTGFISYRNRSHSIPHTYYGNKTFSTSNLELEEKWLTRFFFFVVKNSLPHTSDSPQNEITRQVNDFFDQDSLGNITNWQSPRLQLLHIYDPSLLQSYLIYESYLSWMNKILSSLPFPKIPHWKETNKCLVFLDNRESPPLITAIKEFLYLLGEEEWSLVIFHTDENESFLAKELNSIYFRNILFRRLSFLDWATSNALRTSSVFYDSLPSSCEHILIAESDAIMRFPSNLSKFLPFSPNIGAPWAWCAEQWCRYGGNGGVTLREKTPLLNILREIRCVNHFECRMEDLYPISRESIGEEFNTEDVFIARQVFQHRNFFHSVIPSFNIQQQFSVETMYFNDPVFLHKSWAYLHPLNSIELISRVFSSFELILTN